MLAPARSQAARRAVLRSDPSTAERDVEQLLARYTLATRTELERVGEALATQRKRGAMALTVWRGHLSELAALDEHAVASACETYLGGHVDKDFGYLRAIAKRRHEEGPRASNGRTAPAKAAKDEPWESIRRTNEGPPPC